MVCNTLQIATIWIVIVFIQHIAIFFSMLYQNIIMFLVILLFFVMMQSVYIVLRKHTYKQQRNEIDSVWL